MIWADVLAKFKELFGDEGEIGVYFAPGRVNRTRFPLCTHYWYIWCGKKKR